MVGGGSPHRWISEDWAKYGGISFVVGSDRVGSSVGSAKDNRPCGKFVRQDVLILRKCNSLTEVEL